MRKRDQLAVSERPPFKGSMAGLVFGLNLNLASAIAAYADFARTDKMLGGLDYPREMFKFRPARRPFIKLRIILYMNILCLI